MRWVCGLTIALAACATEPPAAEAPTGSGGKGDYIGNDDRVQLRTAPDPRAPIWANAMATIVRGSSLVRMEDGTYAADVPSLGEKHGLCAYERFRDEPVLGFCSAWLVAPDIVATAAHCFSATTCADSAFVFDYDAGGASGDVTAIPADRVYGCGEILARELTDERDYALVRLDRPTTGRRPFELDARIPEVGTRVALLGYPSGIHAKADLKGVVVRTRGERIEATLDSFPGHSGGVVLDLETGRAIAVHTAGGSLSYRWNGTCAVTAGVTDEAVQNGAASGSIESSVNAFAHLASPSTTPLSCAARCGDADGACACDLACAARGDCCADVATTCPSAPSAPTCLGPDGACATDRDCADLMCNCEGETLVTGDFVAAPGTCIAGACQGDERLACAAACARDALTPVSWYAVCPWE